MDEVFKQIVRDTLIKVGIKDPLVPINTLPLPGLLPKLLFQKRDLVLGRIMNIVGEEASFKTTFSIELARWFIDLGGGAIMLHTEGRLNNDLINGILGDKAASLQIICCDCLEQWQKLLLTLTRELKEKNVNEPVLFIVDSIMGSNLETTREAIEKDGFAAARYPAEARSIADFLRSYASMIDDTTYFLCFINHRKYRMPMQGYMPVKTALGGSEIRFYTCYDLDLRKSVDKIKLAQGSVMNVFMRLDKNTYGTPNIEIQVPVYLIRENGKFYIQWGWDQIAARFLSDGSGVKPPPTQAVLRELQQLLGIYYRSTPKGEFFWSERLGIPQDKAVRANELMQFIYSKQDLLDNIYKILSL